MSRTRLCRSPYKEEFSETMDYFQTVSSETMAAGEKMQRVKFPMADLEKIGKEAFDILNGMPQQQRQQLLQQLQQPFKLMQPLPVDPLLQRWRLLRQLPVDPEAKHYELPNALTKPWKNHVIGAQSTAAVVVTETKNKDIPIFGK
ncbi:hypothetical protein RHSIM_Rhsim04G0227200 [Rhododendron simsii]|uniref:Uncharacterized protein n=1 Tax=Rhododendron simsii TaxID=118357 RepID=A0A834LPE7_RHOSS|nr:hypothetical protein RHSIM_Rhsim04G0227200 [Rhododendron simsii]